MRFEYQAEVNKGSINMRSLTGDLNKKGSDGLASGPRLLPGRQHDRRPSAPSAADPQVGISAYGGDQSSGRVQTSEYRKRAWRR